MLWEREKDCAAVEELPKSGAHGEEDAVEQPRCGASSACREGGEALTEVVACVNRHRKAAGLCWEPHDSKCAGSAPAPDESARRAARIVSADGGRPPPQPEGLGVRTARPGTKSRAPVPGHGTCSLQGALEAG